MCRPSLCFPPVWLCLLVVVAAAARELTPSPCDSSIEGLLHLDDMKESMHTLHVGEHVVLEGFVYDVYSPKHFVIQSTDGSTTVTALCISPMKLAPQVGERIQAWGSWVQTGTQTHATLLLPGDAGDHQSVILCEKSNHRRRLKYDGYTWDHEFGDCTSFDRKL